MRAKNKTVRQSVSLPEKTAAQVRILAKTRRVSSNRMLVELIENGIEAEKRRQQEFFDLAERFRNATDPETSSAKWCLATNGSDRALERPADGRAPTFDGTNERKGDQPYGPKSASYLD
jgi:hypothetical protein